MPQTATQQFLSERLKRLPPYLFVEIDRAKREAKAQGRDIIDLGVGDPDQPTFPHIVDAMKKAVEDPSNHRYALDAGLPALRQTFAEWFKDRFGVALDPDGEIYPVIGTKEGLAHLPLAVFNPGDRVVLTDPAYPAYRAALLIADASIQTWPLKKENGFLPDLNELKQIKDIKAVYINSPNNPTTSVADRQFYSDLVALAHDKGFFIISDMAYSEIYFDGEAPVSLLEIEGAKEIAIEFHSLSKTYNMTGWRIGFACGNRGLIQALAKIKSNFDSGIFQAIQVAGIAALKSPRSMLDDLRNLYQQRRDILVDGLNALGWAVPKPKASFYVWAPIPKGFTDSMTTAQRFLKEADVVVTPGVGFGPCGEGYVRMTLTVATERLKETTQRLKRLLG